MSDHQKYVWVYPADAYVRRRVLFSALEQILPIRFASAGALNDSAPDALICFGSVPSNYSHLRALAVLADDREAEIESTITFQNHSAIHPAFARKTFTSARPLKARRATLSNACAVLAAAGSQPIWWFNPADNSQATSVFPETDSGDRFLFEVFQRNPLELIPLLNFLWSVSLDARWTPPPIRANIMFDDPNLHACSYGYLSYREIIEHAKKNRYHISFATIPLDSWFTNRAASELVKANPDRISLLVHGNNHVTEELARNYSEKESVQLLAQAIRRTEALEKRTGIPVSRVMAAPHGACAEPIFRAMPKLGFEGACISRGSIMARNKELPWSAAVGFFPAEFLAGAFPVIPRFRLSFDCLLQCSLSAFFNQPIIPVGHHEEVRDGLELLATVAKHINSIGEVQWLDLRGISRSNFVSRVAGRTFTIQPFSRYFTVTVPKNCAELALDRIWVRTGYRQDVHESLFFRRPGDASWTAALEDKFSVTPGEVLELKLQHPQILDARTLPAPAFRAWPIARRVLAECRDRARPWYERRREKTKKSHPIAASMTGKK